MLSGWRSFGIYEVNLILSLFFSNICARFFLSPTSTFISAIASPSNYHSHGGLCVHIYSCVKKIHRNSSKLSMEIIFKEVPFKMWNKLYKLYSRYNLLIWHDLMLSTYIYSKIYSNFAIIPQITISKVFSTAFNQIKCYSSLMQFWNQLKCIIAIIVMFNYGKYYMGIVWKWLWWVNELALDERQPKTIKCKQRSTWCYLELVTTYEHV